MATSFPAGLDSLTNPTSSDTLDSPDHAGQHSDANDAIEALQAKVGIDNSAVTTSLDYLVRYAAPVGAMTSYVGATAPDSSWVICNGAAISRTTYSDLYSLIGTTYGSGDGSTTFNVPNLKGRVIVGFDSANGSFDVLGETGGAETHTLTEAELPSHNHSINHDHASVTSGSGGADHNHSIDHDHASVTSGSGGAAHTHSINHDHASVTSGSSGNAHTHSIDPPNTTSSSSSHSHGQSGLTTNNQAYNKFTKRMGSGSNWDVSSSNLARWDSATNPATSSSSHTHTTNVGSFTSGGASATSHTHSVNLPNFSGNSGSTTASHTHSVDVPNFSGTSGSTNASHTHSVDVASYSGDSGSTGSGTAHNNLQPYMALNWIIKAK